MKNPYAEIRKVPLDYNGIQSSAYSVQYQEGHDKWKEAGVVGSKYMLLPNSKVKEAADQVVTASNIEFENDKTFFDGKRYVYSLKSTNVIGNVKPGDDMALGVQFWNSYDGSKSFGFSMMLYRLICTNGMMSKKFFNTFRFKHEPNSEDWQESLAQVVNTINATADNGMDNMISNLRKLDDLRITSKGLGKIRHEYLSDIPSGLWGNIMDRFLDPSKEYYSETSGWGLLNAATDILWHKDKPTIASYNQNASVVDGLCRAVSA
jgi:hypothetical protein